MSESFIESIFYKRGSLNSASYLQVNAILKHRFVSYAIKCLLLYWPAAGYRNNTNGTLNNRGNNGKYWSSTENSTNAWNLNFNSTNANTNNNNRTNGFSVRCVSAFNTNLYY